MQVTIESWLISHRIIRKEYLKHVVNRHLPIDGLFLWLAVWAAEQHVNVLHAGGIWTLRQCEIPVLTDATIVLVLGCFLTSPQMQLGCPKLEDNTYIKPLANAKMVQNRFVAIPRALNKPARNVTDRNEEVDMYATGPAMLIQDCLANILECTTSVYHEQICHWLEQNSADLPMIAKWLAVRGISLPEYQQILGNQGALDGLEVWAASMAFNQPINMVLEDSVWGTAHDGIDFMYPTFLLSDYDKFVPCALSCEDADQPAVAAAPPTSPMVVERSRGG